MLPLLAALLIAPTARAPTARVAQIRAKLAEAAATPPYRIDAVRVGAATAKRSLFILDPSLPDPIDIAFAFWVIRGGERVILVDTGFTSKKMRASWKVRDYRAPTAGIAALGVAADAVTDVIITHNHWDHIGGLVAFPGARIHIGARDADAITGVAARGSRPLAEALARARKEGRLERIDALRQIAPGVVVVPVGLHTPGFQYVVVQRPAGPWVLASDIGPLRASFTRRAPSGQTSDRAAARAVLDEMLALTGGDLSRIVPGHEPSLFDRSGLARVTPARGAR